MFLQSLFENTDVSYAKFMQEKTFITHIINLIFYVLLQILLVCYIYMNQETVPKWIIIHTALNCFFLYYSIKKRDSIQILNLFVLLGHVYIVYATSYSIQINHHDYYFQLGFFSGFWMVLFLKIYSKIHKTLIQLILILSQFYLFEVISLWVVIGLLLLVIQENLMENAVGNIFEKLFKNCENLKSINSSWKNFTEILIKDSIIVYSCKEETTTPYKDTPTVFFRNKAFIDEFHENTMLLKLKIVPQNEKYNDDFQLILQNADKLYKENQSNFYHEISMLFASYPISTEGKFITLYPRNKKFEFDNYKHNLSYTIFECQYKRINWEEKVLFVFQFREKSLENIFSTAKKLKSIVTKNIATIAHELKLLPIQF